MWFLEECNIFDNLLIGWKCVWKAKISHQWICPKNWHVASDEDFKVLEDELNGSGCKDINKSNSWWECNWLWWKWNKLDSLFFILSWVL